MVAERELRRGSCRTAALIVGGADRTYGVRAAQTGLSADPGCSGLRLAAQNAFGHHSAKAVLALQTTIWHSTAYRTGGIPSIPR